MRGRAAQRMARFYPLIGLLAAITLIAFVYVSYTADSGLPFQSHYVLFAKLGSAERLIVTDEVRIGGVRVGQVSSVAAEPGHGGRPFALVGLALSPGIGRLRADTVDEVESSSPLGQTYVNLIPGKLGRLLPSGSILPQANSRNTVQLTDLLDTFNAGARHALQSTIGQLGVGMAGRGEALNEALADLPTLLPAAGSVAATLASARSDLAGFVSGLGSFSSAVAPVAAPLGGLVSGAAGAFSALAAVAAPLGQAVTLAPAAERAASVALRTLHTPLDRLAALTVRLRSAGALLPAAVGQINRTLRNGTGALRSLTRFAPTLGATLTVLRAVAERPTTPGAVRQLISMLSSLQPLLSDLLPAQTDCNVLGLYGRNFSSAWGSLGTGIGPSYVVAGVVTPGAQGESLQAAAPAPNLHINYLPHENARECESGNEPFSPGTQDLTNPPGDQSRTIPATAPPEAATAAAARAGLLTPPRGTPR